MEERSGNGDDANGTVVMLAPTEAPDMEQNVVALVAVEEEQSFKEWTLEERRAGSGRT